MKSIRKSLLNRSSSKDNNSNPTNPSSSSTTSSNSSNGKPKANSSPNSASAPLPPPVPGQANNPQGGRPGSGFVSPGQQSKGAQQAPAIVVSPETVRLKPSPQHTQERLPPRLSSPRRPPTPRYAPSMLAPAAGSSEDRSDGGESSPETPRARVRIPSRPFPRHAIRHLRKDTETCTHISSPSPARHAGYDAPGSAPPPLRVASPSHHSQPRRVSTRPLPRRRWLSSFGIRRSRPHS